MSFLADQDVPNPVKQALKAVRFPFRTVEEDGVPLGGDRGIMVRALNDLKGAVLITCDTGMPSQAYYYQYAQGGLTVVVLRWKGRTDRDLQEMLLAILRYSDEWLGVASDRPFVISVSRSGSRQRAWSEIPESIVRHSGLFEHER